MADETGFYHDERCLWHSTGEAVLFLPVGGWLQPLAGGGHPESPESKRRLKSLLDVSGMTEGLAVSSAEPAGLADLLRVHTADYVERFQTLSAGRGGEIGPEALFSHGGFEIASLSAGLAKQAVADVLDGVRPMPIRCRVHLATTAFPTAEWDSVCWPTSPLRSKRRR
jgi:acetoin utilization deacetylase AcuC-like enzyme